MISEKLWESDYKKEFERATQARVEGNEGKARVCARRAAGIVIGEFLRRRGVADKTNNLYERLTIFNALPEVDGKYKEVCQHFVQKVDQEHNLPGHADLIQEVNWLKNRLLREDPTDYAHTRDNQ